MVHKDHEYTNESKHNCWIMCVLLMWTFYNPSKWFLSPFKTILLSLIANSYFLFKCMMTVMFKHIFEILGNVWNFG